MQTQFDRVSFQICVGFCGVKRVWVWFGLCRSELMVLLKPDSRCLNFRPFVVSCPNESGCYGHGFLFCFELGPCQFWGFGDEPTHHSSGLHLPMAPSSFPISNPTSAYHRQAQTSTWTTLLSLKISIIFTKLPFHAR